MSAAFALITIALPSDKVDRYRAALAAAGLGWTDYATEIAIAAERSIDETLAAHEAAATETPA